MHLFVSTASFLISCIWALDIAQLYPAFFCLWIPTPPELLPYFIFIAVLSPFNLYCSIVIYSCWLLPAIIYCFCIQAFLTCCQCFPHETGWICWTLFWYIQSMQVSHSLVHTLHNARKKKIQSMGHFPSLSATGWNWCAFELSSAVLSVEEFGCPVWLELREKDNWPNPPPAPFPCSAEYSSYPVAKLVIFSAFQLLQVPWSLGHEISYFTAYKTCRIRDEKFVKSPLVLEQQ